MFWISKSGSDRVLMVERFDLGGLYLSDKVVEDPRVRFACVSLSWSLREIMGVERISYLTNKNLPEKDGLVIDTLGTHADRLISDIDELVQARPDSGRPAVDLGLRVIAFNSWYMYGFLPTYEGFFSSDSRVSIIWERKGRV